MNPYELSNPLLKFFGNIVSENIFVSHSQSKAHKILRRLICINKILIRSSR